MAKQRPFTLDVSDWFWSVINRIRSQPDSLLAIMNEMSEQELVQFYQEYREATDELLPDDDEERELTESELHDVCAWVVAQGEDYYRRVWSDFALAPRPDTIPLSDYSGVAAEVRKQKYGRDLFG